MEKAKEHSEEEWRQEEMGRVLGNLFHNVNSGKERARGLREAVEEDLEGWNRDYLETISLPDLAEFAFQIAGCIFAEEQAVDKLLFKKWDSENGDKTHWDEFVDRLEAEGECDHTFRGSKKVLQEMGYKKSEIEEICEWFEFKSAYCDCEVHLNVILREER